MPHRRKYEESLLKGNDVNSYLKTLTLGGPRAFIEKLTRAEKREAAHDIELAIEKAARELDHIAGTADRLRRKERLSDDDEKLLAKLYHRQRVVSGEIVIMADEYVLFKGREYKMHPVTKGHLAQTNHKYVLKG
jgi:hypothetical protein